MTEARLSDIDPACIVELDVRELLAGGVEPLATILAAAEALPSGHTLHLRSPFEPVPLFELLDRRGFDHQSSAFGPDDWSTWVWRADDLPLRAATAVEPTAPIATDILDLRRLAPPEPLLRLLARTAQRREPFRAALPMLPEPLRDLLLLEGWSVDLVEELPGGSVVVRLSPEG
jgi:hypothetical protein